MSRTITLPMLALSSTSTIPATITAATSHATVRTRRASVIIGSLQSSAVLQQKRCCLLPKAVESKRANPRRGNQRSACGRATRSIIHLMRRDLPTAPLAAAGLIAGYAVAAASGSRPLGGVVLAIFGLACVWVWLGRDGIRSTVILTGVGLSAFALSHVIA